MEGVKKEKSVNLTRHRKSTSKELKMATVVLLIPGTIKVAVALLVSYSVAGSAKLSSQNDASGTTLTSWIDSDCIHQLVQYS